MSAGGAGGGRCGVRVVAGVTALLAAAGCARPTVPALSREISARAGDDARGRERHFAALLDDALAKDAYRCEPVAAQVFTSPEPRTTTRTIRGRMPHYGVYHGPMRYRVGAERTASGWRWVVSLNVALDPSSTAGTMELPDCALRDRLGGALVCQGQPYELAPGLEACPDSGTFEAPVTRANLRVLLERWSRDAEAYFNRDAAHYGLPLRYDFELFLADDADASALPVDVRMPLRLSCGRTPYFTALRSGWSMPVLAHELGHFLGLLDEYEALSGVVSFYPKTPFAGSEHSRMGVSMKRHTRLYPLHHYLVLRRYHCPEPITRDPYAELLSP